MKNVKRVEVVADRTEQSRCDEGFLRMRRLILRNHYSDGTRSADYPCDIVSRQHVEAVAIVLYELDAQRCIQVALRVGLRPPVWLAAPGATPAAVEPTVFAEVVAGLLEDDDHGAGGQARRAAKEAYEEAGLQVDPAVTVRLGGPLYASPGISDERVYFRAAPAQLSEGTIPPTDGSPMEEAGHVLVLPLDEALARCRRGEIPDMKTEVALLRLCDQLGYLPLLGRFVDELPPGLQPAAARQQWLMGAPAQP